MTIKIMQYNVFLGLPSFSILDMIEREQPDVICFQEAASDGNGNSGYFGFTHKLLQRFPAYAYHHIAPMHVLRVNDEEVMDGLLVVSKFPLEDYYAMEVAIGYPFDNKGALGDTQMTHAQFVRVLTSDPFLLINYHGYIDGISSSDKSGTPRTDAQIERILLHAKSMANERIVFCGDLNLTPDSSSVKIITKQMRDNVSAAGITNTRAAYVTLPPHVCDYIFTSPDITVTSLRVADKPHEVCSDHLAIFAEFE